jgi:hypothetical protein
MALLEKYQQALKKRTKSAVIQEAVDHESRLKFHTEVNLKPLEISRPVTIFLDWVSTLIPKDKYTTFVNLFRFPTSNVELIKKCYGELERVFDSKNPSSHYRFTDPENKMDWSNYQREVLNQPDVWRTTAWEQMQTSINSILVVDLPAEQKTALPEPYFYFLDISNVIEYGAVQGRIKWIIFEQPGDLVAIFDDEFYRTVKLNSKGEIEEVISEVPHTLGYCPADFYWTDTLTKKHQDLKEAPISAQLSNLDWLLFFATSKKHLDLYAPYPVYSSLAADCDFEAADSGDYCEGGFLRGIDSNYKMTLNGAVQKCPVCADKRLAGAGSFIEVPIPEKDGPDLRKPVDIVTIDRASLDFNVDETERLGNNVFKAVTGSGGMGESKEALNEKHIISNYDAKTSVLNNLKVNLENAKRFVNDTICKLRYGVGYIGGHENMGTEFYVATINDLYKQYALAKENGANEFELDVIKENLIMTEHRTDPQMIERLMLLRQLEPYRHNTRAEVLDLYDKGLVDKKLLQLKINFNNFIDKFERENINVLDFGTEIDFDKKIKIITDKLLEYVNEINTPTEGSPEGGRTE